MLHVVHLYIEVEGVERPVPVHLVKADDVGPMAPRMPVIAARDRVRS
jgi:hypothetical protein